MNYLPSNGGREAFTPPSARLMSIIAMISPGKPPPARKTAGKDVAKRTPTPNMYMLEDVKLRGPTLEIKIQRHT